MSRTRSAGPSLAGCAAAALLSLAAHGDVDPHGGMLRYPAVGPERIVFSYANDLWTVARAGGEAVPLASPPGQETFPRFSPDGKTIAFVGNYEGGRDLYTIPASGGVPFRVTHHPATETLCNWTPDGRLLFFGSGVAGLGRQTMLFTVDPAGGLPVPLPVPYGANGAISGDGKWLAYTPHTRDHRTWKRYRGGMATDIWLFNLESGEAERVTDWEGTDSQPMWHGSTLYYLSDAGPEHRLNIWSYEHSGGRRRQITTFTDFDIKWPSIGPGANRQGEIVFQNGTALHLLDLGTGRSKAVDVRIPGDRPTIRPRRVDALQFVQSWGISATGKRAVAEGRGDIWTLPAENGAPRNLTRTDGVAERSPSWSPDGRWIAYASDATGEYEIWITQSDGKGETRRLTDTGGPFKYEATWSPDSTKLVYSDKTGAMHLVDVESGDSKVFDHDPMAQGPVRVEFSHDGRWITYARTDETSLTSAIWLYDVESDQLHRATSGMFNDSSPVFDRAGNWLYFASDRSFSPTYGRLGPDTTWVYRDASVLLAVPLRSDVEMPWRPKVDEEEWKEPDEETEEGDDEEGDDEGDDDEGDDDEGDDDAAPAPDDGLSGTWEGTADTPDGPVGFVLQLSLAEDGTVTGSLNAGPFSGQVKGSYDKDAGALELSIDAAGMMLAISATVSDGTMTGTATADGAAVPLTARRTSGGPGAGDDDEGDEPAEKPREVVEIEIDGFERRAIQLPVAPGAFGRLAVNDRNQLIYLRAGSGIKIFDITDDAPSEKDVTGGSGGFDISADGKKLLIIRGAGAAILPASAGATPKVVQTDGMIARIEPHAEWEQIFNDAWRIVRDFFYVENMHAVDWEAMRERYAAMLDDCVTREDLSFVIGEMISELNVGHAYYFGGDGESEPSVPVGLLGADFEVDQGAYRIARIVEGAPWDIDGRGPLSRTGVDVAEGDYLLAVNGVPLDVSKDPWAAFIGTTGRPTILTVSASPAMDDEAREVIVEPMPSDAAVRYRAWIESKRRRVDEATDGKVGYIYVPDTGVSGQSDLVRQFFGQLDKAALIIDDRWNGGGQIPTRFIELLNRPRTNYWARRDGRDWPWPPDSMQGPKCMLINGLAGSGGDMFPALFRQAGLGKLIGMRTWGGLVGLSGNPALIDGGYTAVPTFGYYEVDGTWGIEGHGVDPDIEVIDDPSQMQDGGDPQLDAAIALMLEEIESNGYAPPARPEPPDRSGMGVLEKDK